MTKKESKKLNVGDKIILQRKSNGPIYALGIILSIEKPEDYMAIFDCKVVYEVVWSVRPMSFNYSYDGRGIKHCSDDVWNEHMSDMAMYI